jgi:hypothetical protein
MAGEYYRHPDLRIRLNNPNEARIFLDDPRTWLPHKKPINIPLWDGTSIPLNTQKMSDEEAIYAAFLVLGDMIERAMLEDPPFPRRPH